MIRTHLLSPYQGAVKKRKRIGRGQGSGKGGTSTRGHKGDKSRSGYFYKPGFEGGQMPIQRRIPKSGFINPFRKEYAYLNLSTLQYILDKNSAISEIDPDWLKEKGYIKHKNLPIKILGEGEISRPVTVRAHKFSLSAQQKIEAAGGQVIVIEK
ncbi:MAG: 50S ribosomal protein L15 [Bacteroidia bacterium]|nr:50S ribosomal protein L15 [Bacteroidia bacterium]MDW8159372.1 50S ribosomal protein L15 [Bacteroidia bacterium]